MNIGKDYASVMVRFTYIFLVFITILLISCVSCSRQSDGFVFDGMYSTYTAPDGCVYRKFLDKGAAVASIADYTGEVYVVPEEVCGLKVVGFLEKAEIGNSTIKTLILPDNVEFLNFNLYIDFPSLRSVYIGAGLTATMDGVFSMCSHLEQVTVDPRNPVFYSENNCIISRDDRRIINACEGATEIPRSAEVIGGNSYVALHITRMEIPENIKTIDSLAFQACVELKAVFIPATVETVGKAVFRSDYDQQMQVTVFCEAAEKPDGWDDDWCGDGAKEVVWGAEIDDYFSYLCEH